MSFVRIGVLALLFLFVGFGPAYADQSGDRTSRWPSPATGGIAGYSGYVWVLGSGSLGSPVSGGYYNAWVTTWADKRYQGFIDDPYATWVIDANSRSDLNAKAMIARLGGSGGNVRAETTVTAEVRGDFSAFNEVQTAVDNISPTSQSSYSATGGGSPPITYPTGGAYDHKYFSTLLTGRTFENPKSMGCPCQQAFTGSIIVFYMYARGRQYIHNSGERNTSLFTTIYHTDPSQPGWNGVCTVFDTMGIVQGFWALP